jgi:hypothetical protein
MALKNNEDAAFLLVDTMELILKITAFVYSLPEFIKGFDENKKIEINMDMLNLCKLAIDNGIINIVSGLLALTTTSKEAKLILGSDGSVAIEAQSFIQATTTNNTEVSTPTLAARQVAMKMKFAGLFPDVFSLGEKIAAASYKFNKSANSFHQFNAASKGNETLTLLHGFATSPENSETEYL